MKDSPAQLRNIQDHLRSGRFGQREVWVQQLEDAAVEIEELWVALKLVGVCKQLQQQDSWTCPLI